MTSDPMTIKRARKEVLHAPTSVEDIKIYLCFGVREVDGMQQARREVAEYGGWSLLQPLALIPSTSFASSPSTKELKDMVLPHVIPLDDDLPPKQLPHERSVCSDEACLHERSCTKLVSELRKKEAQIQSLKNSMKELQARYQRDTKQLQHTMATVTTHAHASDKLRAKQSRVLKASLQKASANLSYYLNQS
ncbi:hypothetical protein SDRG_06562 [Saprolegnia diclina VS20]|uniref:Uncharacterized protein n=1 Tax=Saprolegnia diclina (strain VS20) TaxID=1156394 RepID=T0QD32_SAPDV|nr:hypothetical protein SDRG_06562 [Saprolegnia diclina VS20]EQC35804.1 hypothetical protein SDRG_06562 [Saprolegnia diclina VS20]|eukprot:XP_008610566.1 hypothetical protein SDRG_06562 [Saprolegnia diclina VS20]